MRPDIYDPRAAPLWAQMGMRKIMSSGGWWHHARPHWVNMLTTYVQTPCLTFSRGIVLLDSAYMIDSAECWLW